MLHLVWQRVAIAHGFIGLKRKRKKMTAMTLAVEIITALIWCFLIIAVVIVSCDIEIGSKWTDIFKGDGRDE